MVNRGKRTRDKHLIEQFASREITNDDFVRRYQFDKIRSATRGNFLEPLVFYEDTHTRRLERKHALQPEGKDLFRRCAAFLGTDLEYEWPRTDGLACGGCFEAENASTRSLKLSR